MYLMWAEGLPFWSAEFRVHSSAFSPMVTKGSSLTPAGCKWVASGQLGLSHLESIYRPNAPLLSYHPVRPSLVPPCSAPSLPWQWTCLTLPSHHCLGRLLHPTIRNHCSGPQSGPFQLSPGRQGSNTRDEAKAKVGVLRILIRVSLPWEEMLRGSHWWYWNKVGTKLGTRI